MSLIAWDLVLKGAEVPKLEAQLHARLDDLMTLTLGETYARFRKYGYDVPHEMPVEELVRHVNAEDLSQLADWTEPVGDEPISEALVNPGPQATPRSCARGHQWLAISGYVWRVNFQPQHASKPLCPYCVIDWAERMFPEVGMLEKLEP